MAFALCTALATAEPPAPTDDWQLESRSHGIDLYAHAVTGSVFPVMRASASVCASIATLSDYLLDHTHFGEWVPDMKRAELLETPSPDERIFRLQLRMPWPLQDRDMVYRIARIGSTQGNGTVTVAMTGLPEFAPPRDKVVRMPSVDGTWRFEEHASRTTIGLELHVDPGGRVKPWLARRRMAALVTGMLANLSRNFAAGCAS